MVERFGREFHRPHLVPQSSGSRHIVPSRHSQIRSDFRVSNIYTENELIQGQTIWERFLATLASFFSAVALLLAAVGLYGVLHYSVQQRRREIAIVSLSARKLPTSPS